MYCDSCAAEPASYDHLDLSGGETVFKRLCRRCADADLARWAAEKPGPAPPAPQKRPSTRDQEAA